ncbi:MAG: lamin tail domain-containing protein [Burkholderiales bacterium]|nr:lamin tail domain-containing protein [Burkholderiales bacterium]
MTSRLLCLWTALVLLTSCGDHTSMDNARSVPAQVAASPKAATYTQPQSGWYWNPSEGGRGYAIERQGNQLFLTAFFYESSGAATWAAAILLAQSDGRYTGEFMKYSGGQTLLGSYKVTSSTKIADVSLAFTTSTAGTLSVTAVGGSSSASIALQAYPISTPVNYAVTNASFDNGWWWNPAEPGRGYFVEVQGSQAFVGSFMYDDSGQPSWYVSTATLTTSLQVDGNLDQYTNGQSLYGAYQAPVKVSTSAGAISMQLTSSTTGNLVLPNGVKVPISRYVFNATPTPSNLIISEVSTAYYTNDVAWFEIYNPNNTEVSLANYSVRSTYIDSTNSTLSSTPMTFKLPAAIVPANGYLVIAGKSFTNLLSNSQIVYISSGTQRPHWGTSGAVELLNNGQTADFVIFGTSSIVPMSAGHWSGANVMALPSGANEHGKSIVRLAKYGLQDTHTAADWVQVNFATPAGTNDVLPGVIDSDNDGIPDSAKVQGGTYAGLDLYAMGARPGRRDAFIEIDYMNGTDPALTPRSEALQKVTDAFAAKNIAIHLDVGNLYSATFNPSLFNLGGGNAVTYASCLDDIATFSGTVTAGCTSFYTYKSTSFDVRRKLIFHYALFGNSRVAGGICGSSGQAEVEGNNFMVTMGSCGYRTNTTGALNNLINSQAGTIMHEFGHNLGLFHGGNEGKNYKPNYYSVMNYMYQMRGLNATPDGVNAADRYYLAYGLKGVTLCTLENSPCSTNFVLSYSDGTSAELDENNLDESLNIGRGSANGAYADWDGNGQSNSNRYSRNIHTGDTSYGVSILKDYNDWGNLKFPFARGFYGSNAVAPRALARERTNPMNEQPRQVIVDDPMPSLLP